MEKDDKNTEMATKLNSQNPERQCELLFPSPLISGQSLYLGGSYCPETNKIYCIPGHAPHVLIIDPETNKCYPMDHPPLKEGQFKYLRSIYVAETQMIYGLPCNASTVLKIDPINQTVSTLPIPFVSEEEKKMPWKYHGGAIHPTDHCIYAIPQSASHVLKLNPMTDEITFVGPNLPGKYKWYGGVLGKTDNAIYGIPHNSSSILRIDVMNKSTNSGVKDNIGKDENEYCSIVTLHGHFETGGHKWHGASISPTQDGTIVCIPANADTVLLIKPSPSPVFASNMNCFDTENETHHYCTFEEIGGPDIIRTGRHRSDGKYKYLGAVASPQDGKVYCLPSGSEYVLQIDVNQRMVQNIGPNIRDGYGNIEEGTHCKERMRQNKWQNGFYSNLDQCVYGIPLNGESVLKIQTFPSSSTRNPIVTTIPLPDPKGGLSKWEGGVMANNGIMYCMPNNHKAVLKIIPEGMKTCPSDKDENESKEEMNISIIDSKLNTQITNPTRTVSNTADIKQDAGDISMSASESYQHGETQKESITALNSMNNTHSDVIESIYLTGIPTLRSSAHRVKHNRKGKGKKQLQKKSGKSKNEIHHLKQILPSIIKRERILAYNTNEIDLRTPIFNMLQQVDSNIVGSWNNKTASLNQSINDKPDLETFHVPPNTLSPLSRGGICEDAQRYLSDFVSNDESFLSLFDRFVTTQILPILKLELRNALKNEDLDTHECKQEWQPEITSNENDEKMTFFYQRPPTLRLQPGPSRASVKTHRDSDYGHQDGEMNYWIPLTDPDITKLTIWVESTPDQGDYHPIDVKYGEVAVFHGSSCRHFVPKNVTHHTRMSLDFRVGVEGYFDSSWMMQGTTDDHSRRRVSL